MNQTLAKELGFIGTNVDQNLALDWLQTEVIDKAKQGDKTALFKLFNIARHSDQPEIVAYANSQLALLSNMAENY